jgi:hypothetical protein
VRLRRVTSRCAGQRLGSDRYGPGNRLRARILPTACPRVGAWLTVLTPAWRPDITPFPRPQSRQLSEIPEGTPDDSWRAI